MVLGGGPDAVEGAAVGLAVLVEGAGAAEAEDACLEHGTQPLAGVELETARAHGEIAALGLLEDLA
jgi:hypothetical protein